TSQYEVLTVATAALPHHSDSPTSAVPAIKQNPRKGKFATISITGITPLGKTCRTRIMYSAATSSVSHGTRNIPNVESSFAAPYREAETGRLIRKGSVCFFLSLTMLVIGRRHAQNIIEIKKNTLPSTSEVVPLSRRAASAITPAAIEIMISKLCSCQSFRTKRHTTLVFTLLPPVRGCVLRWQQRFLRASCFLPRERERPSFHRRSEAAVRRRWQSRSPTGRFAGSRSPPEAQAAQLLRALPAADAASDRD